MSKIGYDVLGGLIDETQSQDADMLLRDWQGGFNVGRICNSPIQRIVSDLPADVGILKDRGFVSESNRLEYQVRTAPSVTEGIDVEPAAVPYDFVIIGASREWGLRRVLFGSIPNVVADRADYSVLMVRRYVPNTLSVRALEGAKRLKEAAGFTTLPAEYIPFRFCTDPSWPNKQALSATSGSSWP